MFHRFFNPRGSWYRPSHLAPSQWNHFNFAINWENLIKMFNLRTFYCQICPPFSKQGAPRAAQNEFLYDDVLYYHYKRTFYFFFVWFFYTFFIMDVEGHERPHRHWVLNDGSYSDVGRSRMTFTQDFK